MDHF
jgi:hypothetical protein